MPTFVYPASATVGVCDRAPRLPPRRALLAQLARAGACSSVTRLRASRRSVSSWLSPGPRVPDRRRRGARGAATCPACAAGCTRAGRARPGACPRRCARAGRRCRGSAASGRRRARRARPRACRCWAGLSSSSTSSDSARALAERAASAPRAFPCRHRSADRAAARRWTISPTGSTPAVRESSRNSPSSSSESSSEPSTATMNPRSGSGP